MDLGEREFNLALSTYHHYFHYVKAFISVIRVEAMGKEGELGRTWALLEKACLRIPPWLLPCSFYKLFCHIGECLPDVAEGRIKRNAMSGV